MQRHLEVPAFHLNPTVKGKVVEPLEVVGAVTVLFSVLTHVIVWATPEKSNITTITISPSVALVVDIVIVIVAAELFVKLFILFDLVTVPAFEDTEIVAGVVSICAKVCSPVNVWAASVRAIVAEVDGNVIVVESVPDRVRVFVKFNVFPAVPVRV